MNDLSKACLDEAKNNMQGAIKHLEAELTKIRAGKANPAMLDGIKVDYYGTPTLISQVANISTPDPRNITIQPWEKSLMGAISKAIQAANLGFNPQQEADMLRIIIPPLTEERRKELAKQWHKLQCKLQLHPPRSEWKHGYIHADSCTRTSTMGYAI